MTREERAHTHTHRIARHRYLFTRFGAHRYNIRVHLPQTSAELRSKLKTLWRPSLLSGYTANNNIINTGRRRRTRLMPPVIERDRIGRARSTSRACVIIKYYIILRGMEKKKINKLFHTHNEQLLLYTFEHAVIIIIIIIDD